MTPEELAAIRERDEATIGWLIEAEADRRALLAEVDRLHTWDGLMSLVDEHYPADIFPRGEDREDRDTGPRIISLLAEVDGLREKVQRSDQHIEQLIEENRHLVKGWTP